MPSFQIGPLDWKISQGQVFMVYMHLLGGTDHMWLIEINFYWWIIKINLIKFCDWLLIWLKIILVAKE